MTQAAEEYIESSEKQNEPLMTVLLFWCGLVVVCSVYVTIPLVSEFAASFETTTVQAAWTGTAFSLFYAVGCLFWGPLSDQYGRKQMMVFGCVGMTITTLLLGFSNHLISLIFLRSIQGAFAAAAAPITITYAVEMFPPQKRVTTIGFISSAFLMAGIIGQIYSSFLNQYAGWPSVFYSMSGLYLLTTLATLFFLPGGNRQPGKVNWDSILKKYRFVLTKRSLLCCYFIGLTLLLSFVGMYTALGSFVEDVFGLGERDILSIRAAGIIGMLIAPFTGKITTRFGMIRVLRAGLAFAAFGLALSGISSFLPFMVVMSVVFAAGIALTVPTLISLVGSLGGSERGTAVSVYVFILFIGASIGPMTAVTLLHTGSYILTFEVLACFLLISLVVSLFIQQDPERHR
ncbi:MFS transporter [Salibacterium aidingense]|uniref:MFS transporter n=1 Tax=Salibacterium aidingense TaxID=384933 RepID=UPI0004011976|nr:MFS transporter [Salibacterium aidingense]